MIDEDMLAIMISTCLYLRFAIVLTSLTALLVSFADNLVYKVQVAKVRYSNRKQILGLNKQGEGK